MMVSNRILQTSRGSFSGAILVSGRVLIQPLEMVGWWHSQLHNQPIQQATPSHLTCENGWIWNTMKFPFGVLKTYFQGKKPWTMLVSGRLVSWFLWDAHVGKYTQSSHMGIRHGLVGPGRFFSRRQAARSRNRSPHPGTTDDVAATGQPNPPPNAPPPLEIYKGLIRPYEGKPTNG